MQDNSTIARANALSCEAVKYAYRQTKDGVVVSFVLHPNDVPDGLALASIGSRWQLAMVELNDDDTPKVSAGEAPEHSSTLAAGTSASRRGGPAPDKERRPFASLPLPQQAALLCQDPVFWAFLVEDYLYGKDIKNADDAADAVRHYCNVSSRSKIQPGTEAEVYLVTMREQFQAWRLVGA